MSASSSGSSRPGTRSSLASSATRDSVTSSSLDDGASTLSPTNSHALAEQSIRDAASTGKGACQLDDAAPGVRDMGWNGTPVPRPVVGGLANDDLFTMTRRFDKQIFHVHSVPAEVAAPRPLSGLDLDMADGDEFSPDKMRAHLERLYMGVLMGLFAGWKHVVRLRSWRESRRTGSFLAVYAAAWLLDALFPVAVAFLMVLILHPPARPVCFPPAPPALIDPRTGGVQKPAAGLLASDDSATGAPEKHKGEAVEQEAHSFVTSMASVCSGLVTSTAAGKRPQQDPYEDNSVPDPTEVTADIAHARDRTNGDDPTVRHDRTREPVARTIWSQTRPAMHLLADMADTWERLGNALSPVEPFPSLEPRLRLAGYLAPLLLLSCVCTPYVATKMASFAAGFAFFGQPVIRRGIELANTRVPDWPRYIELRHSIFRGVPTNAQLVLTLLRIGERTRKPLPPPPTSQDPPRIEPHPTVAQELEQLSVPQDEIDAAVHPDAVDAMREEEAKRQNERKRSTRIMKLLKGTASGGIKTALGADKARALAGGHHSKNRVGVVRKSAGADPKPAGPSAFPARYAGKRGRACLSQEGQGTAAPLGPVLSWTPSGKVDKEGDSGAVAPAAAAWAVSVDDIVEMKKVGGLGWKSKLAVGWAMGAEVVDGLVVTDRDGRVLHMTAVERRDELFNRLLATGDQVWESW